MTAILPLAPTENHLAASTLIGGAENIQLAPAPLRVATGEMCHNRIMFKQFMQEGGMQVCQLDSCRLGGVNEVLAVLLLAARFAIPVCPHAPKPGRAPAARPSHLIVHAWQACSAAVSPR